MSVLMLRDFENRDDAGMIQIRRRFGLGVKPFDIVFAGQLPGQDHLQRDDAVQADLPSFVDHAHPAAGDLFQQFVIAEAADCCS